MKNLVDILKKELKMDFDEAVKYIEKIVIEEGFSHMLTKSLDVTFKQKLDVNYPKYALILACAPELAKEALDVSKNVGLLFPCSFVVYEDNGKIYVSHTSIMTAAVELGLASKKKMDPIIEMTGKKVHKAWDRL